MEMSMKTIKIREISTKVISNATEPFAITMDNVVCGVMIPVSPRWVQEVVHQNLSRIANSIQFGEKEIANGEPFVTLDDALADDASADVAAAPGASLRRVSIREISGRLITEAAEHGESLAITSDNVLHGVLIPISDRWLQQVVDANLSRVVRSIRLGEREIVSGERFVTLDESLQKSAAPAERQHNQRQDTAALAAANLTRRSAAR
jgi:hypothetical protein